MNILDVLGSSIVDPPSIIDKINIIDVLVSNIYSTTYEVNTLTDEEKLSQLLSYLTTCKYVSHNIKESDGVIQIDALTPELKLYLYDSTNSNSLEGYLSITISSNSDYRVVTLHQSHDYTLQVLSILFSSYK